MKKVLIICGGGMSSSVIAKLISEKMEEKNPEVQCDFAGVYEAMKLMEKGTYQLFLESPQIRLFHKRLEEKAVSNNVRLVQIPPLDYVPVPKKLENLSRLILNEYPD